MDAQGRLRATQYIWTAYFFALLIVNGGILFYAQELGIGHIILSIFVTLGSVGATGFVWNWGALPAIEAEGGERKGKRISRIDALLDMMDEQDRAALYQRLSEESGDDAMNLGADGELLRRQ